MKMTRHLIAIISCVILAGCSTPQGKLTTAAEQRFLETLVLPGLPNFDGATSRDAFRWVELAIAREGKGAVEIRFLLPSSLPNSRNMSDKTLLKIESANRRYSPEDVKRADKYNLNLLHISALDMIRYLCEVTGLTYKLKNGTVVITEK